jgi:hypothetical protein
LCNFWSPFWCNFLQPCITSIILKLSILRNSLFSNTIHL